MHLPRSLIAPLSCPGLWLITSVNAETLCSPISLTFYFVGLSSTGALSLIYLRSLTSFVFLRLFSSKWQQRKFLTSEKIIKNKPSLQHLFILIVFIAKLTNLEIMSSNSKWSKFFAINSKPTSATFPELPDMIMWLRMGLGLAYGLSLGMRDSVGGVGIIFGLNVIIFVWV